MNADNEKVINLPGVVTILLGVMTAIELFAAIAPRGLVYSVYDAFAFVPLRLSFALAPQTVLSALADAHALDADAQGQLVAMLNGGRWVYLTPLSYAFLHGGWTHLVINSLTLAAFGAPVARRLEPARFLAFFAACAVAGAFAHFAFHPLDAAPVVGASAAISGTMAGIVRFAFTPGARLGENGAVNGRDARTASLSQIGENRQAMLFLIVWFGANFLLGAFPEVSGSSEPIAWEAHIGGFLFGLLCFGAFEPSARRA
ncbi:rhomboid family intramembrane serine protease [Methylocystis parvus]|uniref:Rhomboid family intramembrane serine protease n=1 Tax=Methylocystis parvus TaxID=134 RepID=A0A6B8M8X5_9HYPH|nr:rhomboid family intramembrane serine protease [Methylocystis parvus]QGM99018.1 rhomboid family intramembrane serine protease [Methylocystis parvus]WBK00617.1 rhomboid family intramembrane serine protease [Methylocystis parvus OBBP]